MPNDTMVDETNMTDDTMVTKTSEKKARKPAGPAKLIRGRMPLPLVWHVRFVLLSSAVDEEGKPSNKGDSEAASFMHTTGGKIMDIRKGDNFAYLTKETKFSQEDIDMAKGQLTVNIQTKVRAGAESAVTDFSLDDAAHLFEVLDNMVSGESTVLADRAAYLELHPRKKSKKKAKDSIPTDEEVGQSVNMDDDGDLMDDDGNLIDDELEDILDS